MDLETYRQQANDCAKEAKQLYAELLAQMPAELIQRAKSLIDKKMQFYKEAFGKGKVVVEKLQYGTAFEEIFLRDRDTLKAFDLLRGLPSKLETKAKTP